MSINPDDFADSVWQPLLDEQSGCYYFMNSITQETTWINPKDADFKVRRAEEKAHTAAYLAAASVPVEDVAEEGSKNKPDGIFAILTPHSLDYSVKGFFNKQTGQFQVGSNPKACLSAARPSNPTSRNASILKVRPEENGR